MTKFMKSIVIATFLAGGALPALAQSAQQMTCGDYMAMDAAGRSSAATAFQAYAMDPANSATATIADEQLHGLSVVEVEQMIEAHCQGQTAGTNLIERFNQLQ